MRYIRVMCTVAMMMVTSSCATLSGSRSEESIALHPCSETQKGTIAMFLEGLASFDLSLMHESISGESSIPGVFGNNDEELGKEIIRQIIAHPEVTGVGKNCNCTLLSLTNTSDPHGKVAVVKRIALFDLNESQDELRDYKRSFLVRFASKNNCMTAIYTLEDRWQRI